MRFTFRILSVLLSLACIPFGHSGSIPTQPVASLIKTTAAGKRILWITDTHLNASNRDAFINSMKNDTCEAIFITGDIANGNLIETLRAIADRISTPIYFVLGNTDNAYGSNTEGRVSRRNFPASFSQNRT